MPRRPLSAGVVQRRNNGKKAKNPRRAARRRGWKKRLLGDLNCKRGIKGTQEGAN